MKKVQKFFRITVVIVISIFLSSCAGLEPILQQGQESIGGLNDITRSVDRLARSTERLADQTAETSQSVKQLQKQTTCVEVKNASAKYNAVVRLVGTDQRYPLSSTEYIRFKVPVERFADQQTFTVEMDIYTKNGTYVPPVVPQEVRNNFSRHQLTDKGCGILYFTDSGRVGKLVKASQVRL